MYLVRQLKLFPRASSPSANPRQTCVGLDWAHIYKFSLFFHFIPPPFSFKKKNNEKDDIAVF